MEQAGLSQQLVGERRSKPEQVAGPSEAQLSNNHAHNYVSYESDLYVCSSITRGETMHTRKMLTWIRHFLVVDNNLV